MKSIVALILCGLLAAAKVRAAKDKFRFVNGEEVQLGERPFQVSVQDFNGDFCSGSIVNEYWVVTAAHCVVGEKPSSIKLVVGTIDLREPYSTHQAKKIIVHKRYKPKKSDKHDIALIKVATPFKFSDLVKPVVLPEPHSKVKINSTAILSGWGRLRDYSNPNRLQKVLVYVVDPEHCADVMAEEHEEIYPTYICAHDRLKIRGQCHGDSGGPLTSMDGVLVGIASWSLKLPNCGSTKLPDIYTRVSEYVDWIQEHAQ